MGGLKLLRMIALLTALAVIGALQFWSALRQSAHKTAKTFPSETIYLGDNNRGGALLALTAAPPGAFDEGCITVTYSGKRPAQVRLYGRGPSRFGSILAPYLDLTITRGSFRTAPEFDSCAGFAPDATDYIGRGAGVIFNGTLRRFNGLHTSVADGLTDRSSASRESWTTSESHVYRIRVRLRDDGAAQNPNVSESFVWESRAE
jgi:hypothetical protein